MLLEWIVVLVLNKLFEGKDPRELYGYHLGRALSFLMPCYFGPCLSLFHRAYQLICPKGVNTMTYFVFCQEFLSHYYRMEVPQGENVCMHPLQSYMYVMKHITISITSYQAHNIPRTLDRDLWALKCMDNCKRSPCSTVISVTPRSTPSLPHVGLLVYPKRIPTRG